MLASMSGPDSLQDLCIAALARMLVPLPDFARNLVQAPHVEVQAEALFSSYLKLVAPRHPQLPVLQAFAPQWQAATLKLHGSTREPGPFIPLELPSLRLVGHKLLHLEVADRALTSLQLLTGCTAVQCLSLRGCYRLHSLEGLPQLAELRSLDIAGLSQLSKDSTPHIARLPHLVALNASRTTFGDTLLQDLTYGLRLAAWTLMAGQSVPPELASWPCSRLQRLRMRNCTGVTTQGLQCLELLPDLRFLDARGTGLANRDFVPLQRKFALSSPQGAVLTNSNALLSAFVGRDAVDCACGGAGSQTALAAWQQAGIRLLLLHNWQLPQEEIARHPCIAVW